MSDPRHPILPGQYLIQAKAPGLYLAAEDEKPLLPRKVFTLPHGTLAARWTVEAIDERRYYIKINNAPTKAVENKIFAIQIWQPVPEHEIWVIQNRPQQGPNVYTVTSVDGLLYWVVDHAAPYTQVTVKKLGLIPENPPPEALFTFARVH